MPGDSERMTEEEEQARECAEIVGDSAIEAFAIERLRWALSTIDTLRRDLSEKEKALEPFAERYRDWAKSVVRSGNLVPPRGMLACYPAAFTMAECAKADSALARRRAK